MRLVFVTFFFFFLPLCASDPLENIPYVFPNKKTGNGYVDVLYWKPYAPVPTGLEYTETVLPEVDVAIPSAEKIQKVRPSFHPGFRVGFDWNMPISYWNVGIEYTRLVAKDEQTFVIEDPDVRFQGIWDTLRIILFSDKSIQNTTEQNSNLNTLDADLIYDLYEKHFVFRPFIGLGAALIKNDLYPTYRSVDLNINATIENRVRLTSNFRGIGLRGGFYSDYAASKWWKFFTKTAFSLLVSRNTFRSNSSFQLTNDIVGEISGTSRSNAIRELGVQSAFFLSLGTSFAYESPCYDRYTSLGIAYEMSLWPDLLYFQRLQAGSDAPIEYYRNHYGSQGLTIRLLFGF